MAYGSAKGRIFRGDIYAEDDPNQDTYIDWGNDFISFGVGGVKVLNVSASNTLVQVLGKISASQHITASGHVSASTYYGDGQYLKNVSGTPAGATKQIQFNEGGAFFADPSLQWSATPQFLIVSGTISASSTLKSKYVTASVHVSASAFYGDGQYLKNVGGGGSGGGIFTTLATGNAYTTSSIRVGSAGEPSASLHVSGTGAGAGPVFRLDSNVAGGRPLFFVSGSGRIGIGTDSPARSLEIEDPTSAAFQLTALNARGAGLDNSYSFISDSYGFSIFDTTIGGTPGYRLNIADGGGTTTRGYVGIGNGAGVGGSTFPTAQLHVSSSNGGATFRVDAAFANPALFITGSGQVGIGTISPASLLHVSGADGALFQIDALSGSVPSANTPILFVTGGAVGRIGIGTADPGASLDIVGDTSSDQLHDRFNHFRFRRGSSRHQHRRKRCKIL